MLLGINGADRTTDVAIEYHIYTNKYLYNFTFHLLFVFMVITRPNSAARILFGLALTVHCRYLPTDYCGTSVDEF